jgi:molybdopterin-guanine dinucleotide biosynthesis protein
VKTLRIVGPPGSGKTLLATMLVEALRTRGHRVAVATVREPLGAAPPVTVVTLPGGGRLTLERPATLEAVARLVSSADPQTALLLAEGFAEGAPAIAIGATPGTASLATVSAEAVRVAFERAGPAGEVAGLAAIVEREVLGVAPPPGRVARLRAWLRRGR